MIEEQKQKQNSEEKYALQKYENFIAKNQNCIVYTECWHIK